MRPDTLSADFTPLDHPNVDLAAGIIRDVVVMAFGPIKWDRGHADATTLKTVKECALERFGEDGFPILFNPETLDHGPGGMAGSGQNLRITARGLICDIHLLRTFTYRDHLVEIATRQPKTVGLSIEYYPEPETIGGKDFMRCLYFDGAAVVYTPAATPALYSQLSATRRGKSSLRPTGANLLTLRAGKQPLLMRRPCRP